MICLLILVLGSSKNQLLCLHGYTFEPSSSRSLQVLVLYCREHFEGMEVKNACYSHAWDPTETKLLAVGGPLAFGLSGNYAATWS